MNIRMKNYQSKLIIFTLAFLISWGTQAGNVTSTFNTGDTLTATQMTEIKDAVNDNDSRAASYEIVSQAFPYTLCSLTCGLLRSVACPAGKAVVGGGVDNPHFGVVVIESHPEGLAGWEAWIQNRNATSTTGTMTVQAICADVTINVAPRASITVARDGGSSTENFTANFYDVSPDTRLEAISNLWDAIRATSRADEDTQLVLANAISDSDPRVAELASQAVDFIEALKSEGALQQ